MYTDSAYVAHSVPILETVPLIKPTTNASSLFSQLHSLIVARSHPFFIGHLQAHLDFPGPLSAANALADAATQLDFPVLLGSVTQVAQAHSLHHLNAHTLNLMFKITKDQAQEIVKNCPDCSISLSVPHLGINPRGLFPNEVCQMDVTHLNEFGKLKYIHVTL